MNTLKNYVDWKLTHADKTAEANGVPLVMENCKGNRRMKQLEVYGNSEQIGKNLIRDNSGLAVGESYTHRGVTFTRNSDGSYTVNGTNDGTGNSTLYINKVADTLEYPFKPGTYYMIPRGGKIALLASNMHYEDGTQAYAGPGSNASGAFIIPKQVIDSTIYIQVSSGKTAKNEIVYPMISKESISEDDFEVFKEPAPETPIEIESVGILVTNEADENYGKYMIPVIIKNEKGAVTANQNIFLDEPLRKIGVYTDYIVFENKKVVRNIGKYILTGDEDYSNVGNDVIWSFPKLSNFMSNPHKSLCSHYQHHYTYSELTNTMFTVGQKWINIGNAGFTTLEEFIEWTKKQNIVIYSPLIIPIEESITCELPRLTSETSVIELDTSLLPSIMYGKYIKRS